MSKILGGSPGALTQLLHYQIGAEQAKTFVGGTWNGKAKSPLNRRIAGTSR